MAIKNNIKVITATLADYLTIQNMARFYVYDRTPYMGWECAEDGMFECIDFKHYLESPAERAYLIKIDNELAGFVLLDKECLIHEVDWNMGEFFILAKFQGKGVGYEVASEIFKMHPGKWSVAVMPENIKALRFWHKAVDEASAGNFAETFKTAQELKTAGNPDPYPMNILSFDTRKKGQDVIISVRKASENDLKAMLTLSYEKRRSYEQAQPQFWKYAAGAEEVQTKWFKELLAREDHILLVAESQHKVVGFVIGCIMKAPEVYDPQGLTLMIDDFCVESPSHWQVIGGKLIEELEALAKPLGAVQVLVVCGAHDGQKRQFLKSLKVECASEWYVGRFV